MTDNVIELPGSMLRPMRTGQRDAIPSRAVLENAVEHSDRIDAVLVLGITTDGKLWMASSTPHLADTLLLLRRAERRVMAQFDDDELAGD